MATPTTPSPPTKPADPGPSTASIIGGVALLGAAAGYAALAMRFRPTAAASTARKPLGAEMRAAEAFSKEWARSADPVFTQQPGASTSSSEQQREQQRRAREHAEHKQWRRQQERAEAAARDGPPAWALKELGLSAGASLGDAKAAYRTRAKELHPDSGGAQADEAAFQKLGQAWKAVQEHKGR